MTTWLFAVGTLLVWVGWFFVLRIGTMVVRRLSRDPSLDLVSWTRTVGLFAGIAAAAFLVGSQLASDTGRSIDAPIKIPLVWLIMPFLFWAGAVCIIIALIRLGQWLSGVGEERQARGASLAVWSAMGIGFVVWGVQTGGNVEVLRGVIGLNYGSATGVFALALCATLAMSLAGRQAAELGWSKVAALHAALLIGSVVFGAPFVWLLSTSFKEDRDMVSETGPVWIPRVAVTEPYFDPDDPLYAVSFEGERADASLIERLPNGRLRLDIIRPLVYRGRTLEISENEATLIPKDAPVVETTFEGRPVVGMVVKDLDNGDRRIRINEPIDLKGREFIAHPDDVEPVRVIGLRWQNYRDALEFLPPETHRGLVYLKNTLIIVILSVIGTLFSSAIVAYAFARMRFPGRTPLFLVLLSTMMLPAAVTLLPTFLIFRSLGMIDTLTPLWLPAFFASAFNVFLLRQFFSTIPLELEDAATIDGCSHFGTFWRVMLPQIKPALAVIAIWTFMGAWNNFMGPLIYINSPENMPISYALQLFQSDRGGEPGMLMAFATLAMLPVLLLFFFAQRYFIEGVTLSGLGGR